QVIPFTQPVFDLGALDLFGSPAELRTALALPGTPGPVLDRRVAIALVVATRHVLDVLGYDFSNAVLPADPAPLDVTAGDVDGKWGPPTTAAAVRFYKSPDVPFGVAGGW